MDSITATTFGDVYAAHRHFFWLGGTALLFLLYLLRQRRLRTARLRLSGGELGSVCVTPAAVREIVGAVCRDAVPEGRSQIRIRSRRGRLHIRVKLRMPMGGSACAAAQKIQSAAATCLRSQFGIDRFCAIDVIIGGFRGSFASGGESYADSGLGAAADSPSGEEGEERELPRSSDC
jgi:hypothetical protein